jgi:hypothetical protein
VNIALIPTLNFRQFSDITKCYSPLPGIIKS